MLSCLQESDSNPLVTGVRQHEYQLIIDTLRETGGSRKDAAQQLGISPRTLRYKLAKMREDGVDLDAMLG